MDQRLDTIQDQTAQTLAPEEPMAMRMSDVEKTESIDLTPSFPDGVFETPEPIVNEWKSRGPIGIFEQWGRIDKSEMLPFAGTAETALKSVSLLNSIDRIKKNQYQDETQRVFDEERIANYLLKQDEERVRGVSFGGKVVSGVSQMPAFMIEFLSTGGAAALAKTGARKIATTALRKGAEASLTKLAARSIAPIAVAGARTLAMPQAVAKNVAERQVQSNFQLTEKGRQLRKDAKEKPMTSFVMGFADTMVEAYSEASGEFLGKLAGVFIPKGLTKSLEKIYKRLHPNEAITKLWTKAGFHGILNEMGEERLGDLLRAVFGIEDFGAKDPDSMLDRLVSSIPNAEQLLLEAAIFSVPGMGQLAMSQMMHPSQAKPDTSKEITDEEADAISAAVIEKGIQEELKPSKEAEKQPKEEPKAEEAPVSAPEVEKAPTEAKTGKKEAVKEDIEGKISGVAKDIEKTAIKEGLAETGYTEELAKFENTTVKEQDDILSEVMKDIETAKQMVRGEEALPKGLKGSALLASMIKYATKTKDGALMLDLSKSQFATDISEGGSELSIWGHMSKNTALGKIRELQRFREKSVEKIHKVKSADKIKSKMKKDLMEKVTKEKPNKYDWTKLLDEVTC